jgi:hypothetical protein
VDDFGGYTLLALFTVLADFTELMLFLFLSLILDRVLIVRILFSLSFFLFCLGSFFVFLFCSRVSLSIFLARSALSEFSLSSLPVVSGFLYTLLGLARNLQYWW